MATTASTLWLWMKIVIAECTIFPTFPSCQIERVIAVSTFSELSLDSGMMALLLLLLMMMMMAM
jgi:hypothetical protein